MIFLRQILLFIFVYININSFAQVVSHWEDAAPMPVKIANNTIASITLNDTSFVYTFMGIDSTKKWDGITRQAFRLNTVTYVWTKIAPVPKYDVPGSEGRLAASSQSFNGKIYIFGGYHVASNGGEFTSPNVDIYDPVTNSYTRGADIPVKVDDMVSGVWKDSLIYLVSGWSTNKNVNNVQVYNPKKDSWQQATAITGPKLFGHAGSIVGDTLVYIDGVRINRNDFVISGSSYMGVINPENPLEISWTKLATHPGKAVYRAAAGSYGHRVVFSGGSNNPYNINGIGYNGKASKPENNTFGFNTKTQEWEIYSTNSFATMDHHDLAVFSEKIFLAGGMESGQKVTGRTSFMTIDSIVSAISPENNLVPRQTKLCANFPNPFNPETIITYQLQKTGPVKLIIYNVQGGVVKKLVNKFQSAGNYQVVFSAANLASGVYYYTLKTRANVQTRKMVLLK
jgi:N-acetylneuraminic acid mutarotase